MPIDPLSPGGLSPLSRAPVPVAASPTNAVAIRVAVGAGPTQALIALVDVDSQGSGGLLAVRVNGREQLATASPDFRVGGRYLAEVRTPQTGGPVELRTLAPGEDQSDLLTKALLRSAGAASPYPESLDRIATALASGDHDATSDVVRRAADTAKAAIDKSRAGREGPPTGEGLRAFVRDGGLQYEAKLKTLTEAGGPVAQNHPELAGDVKGAILGLLRAVSTTGADPAATSLADAARDTVAGIEARQALNVLAGATGGPFAVPLPIGPDPDGGVAWAAIEPEDSPAGSGEGATTFRVSLRLALTELGETWVDAGVGPGHVRVIVYVGDETRRSLVASKFDELRSALAADGFSQSLLDVRPIGDLPAATRRRATAAEAGVSDAHPLVDSWG